MTDLTPKQEAFCQAYVKSGNASEAYRSAYDVGIATKMETVNRKAKEVYDNGKVAARIDALRAELAERTMWSREEGVKVLKRVIEEGSPRDAVAAVKELNAMHGTNEPAAVNMNVQGKMTFDASLLSTNTLKEIKQLALDA